MSLRGPLLIAAGTAGGAAAAAGWGVLPPAAWWPGVLLGLWLLGLATRRWMRGLPVGPAATPPAADDATRLRMAMLERRARQFDEAEKLVALGSYD